MLTMHKIVTAPGDRAAARAAAAYALEEANAPTAYGHGDYWAKAEGGAQADQAHAIWLGSSAALGAFGVRRGQEVTSKDLTEVLQGRHVTTGAQVRRPSRQSRPRKVAFSHKHASEVPNDVANDARKNAGKAPLETRAEGVRRAAGNARPETPKNDANASKPLATVVDLDATFGGPKSVSIVAALSGPEQQAAIKRAALRAGNAMVEHMAQTKAVVHRRVGGGRRIHEPARGFAAAMALHTTARRAEGEKVPSPHLHVHCLIVGLERFDGQLAAIASEKLFKDDAPLEAGAIGRVALAWELVQLGYRVRSGTGRNGRFFEIEGVPEGLIERMSGRTRDVERRVRELERERGEKLRGAALSVVAKETRQDKDPELSPEYVAQVWAAHAAEFGFGPEQVQALARHGPLTASVDERMTAASALALQRLRDRGPTVSVGDARATVFEAAQGLLSVPETYTVLEQLARSGELIGLEGDRVTTRAIRALEREALDVACRAGRENGGRLSMEAVAAGIGAADARLAPFSLDGEQLTAVTTLTQGARWAVLTGRAGTGKSPVLQAVATAYRADGWRVIPCAVDNMTVQRLGHAVGQQACSLERLRTMAASGRLEVDDRTVILVDEASKVGGVHWAELAHLCAVNGARVLVVGHDGQLDAIELPGLFAEMLREWSGIPVAELREIRRHRDPSAPERIHPWLRDYQVALDDGEAVEAIEMLARNGALHWHDGRHEAIVGMVDEWDVWRRDFDPGESMMIVHGSNQDVDLVNELAQRRRLEAGELRGEGVPAVDRPYRIYEGDVVVMRGGAYRFERERDGSIQRAVENGQVGIVERIDGRRRQIHVRIQEPGHGSRRATIDVGRLEHMQASGRPRQPSLRLAYSAHTNPLQGANIKGTSELGGHHSEDRNAAYVAGSRNIYRHSKHLAREDFGVKATDQDRQLRYAERVRASHARTASIALGEDPSLTIHVRPHTMLEVPALPTRADVELSDGLETKLIQLGPRNASIIGERADLLGEALRARSDEWLAEQRSRVGDPLAHLDRAAASATRDVQAQQEAAARRVRMARREAAYFEERAADQNGITRRRERRSLLEAAGVQHELIARDEALLAKLAAIEGRQRKDGRHLDDWVAVHGEQVVRWLALEREIAVRRELHVGAEAERAVAEPPAWIEERIGPVPAHDAAERADWESLVRQLTRDRLDGREPGGAAADLMHERQVEQRVAQLREQRGMEPLARAREEYELAR